MNDQFVEAIFSVLVDQSGIVKPLSPPLDVPVELIVILADIQDEEDIDDVRKIMMGLPGRILARAISKRLENLSFCNPKGPTDEILSVIRFLFSCGISATQDPDFEIYEANFILDNPEISAAFKKAYKTGKI